MTDLAPIAVLDVAYAADAAGVGCVLADGWAAASARAEIRRCFTGVPAAYMPGEFYKRELPLLRAVIAELVPQPAVVVIDGYVWLGHDRAPGLGARLFEMLRSAIPVIGVAKTRYRDDTWSAQVRRGKSLRPLYVTAAGLDDPDAAALISAMHGAHRIPTLLRQADRAARAALAAGRP